MTILKAKLQRTKLFEAKTREQSRKIQEYMLDQFDSYEDLISEIKHYINDYSKGQPWAGRNAMVDQCFYSDIDDLKEFFHNLYSDQHYTPEQQAKFDHRYDIPSGRSQIEQQYKGLIQMEIENLYRNPTGGGKNYIAPRNIKEAYRSGELSDDNPEGFISEADESYYQAAKKGLDVLNSTVSQLYDILEDLNVYEDVSADSRILYLFDEITHFIEEKEKELEDIVD
jgi:hypothetical protein